MNCFKFPVPAYCFTDYINSLLEVSALAQVGNELILQSVSTFGKRNESCLHLAIYLENAELLMQVLHRGADINHCDLNGRSGLGIAVSNCNSLMAQTLLANGANTELPDKLGRTPLHLACLNHATSDLMDILLSYGADPNACFGGDRTCLTIAIQRHHLEFMRKLLSAGALLEHPAGHHHLHVAVCSGTVAVAEILLDHGADLKWRDQNGDTSLFIGVRHATIQSIEFLLVRGADINTRDKLGCSAAVYAALTRSLDVLDLLMSYGASVDERDQDGNTLLHIACKCRKLEMAEALISYGANPETIANNGRKPVDYLWIESEKARILEAIEAQVGSYLLK